MGARGGIGLQARCTRTLSRYSAASPACFLFAIRCSRPWYPASATNFRAASSNSIRSTRSSVARITRETTESSTIAAMKAAEMAIPSGFSITLSTSAYSSTAVTTPKPALAHRCRCRWAHTVTAIAADTIMARIPVA